MFFTLREHVPFITFEKLGGSEVALVRKKNTHLANLMSQIQSPEMPAQKKKKILDAGALES